MDTVTTPRLPSIFAGFVGDIVDAGIIELSSAIDRCRQNLQERNFCPVMMHLVCRFEELENTTALDNIRSMNISFPPKLVEGVFKERKTLLQYFH